MLGEEVSEVRGFEKANLKYTASQEARDKTQKLQAKLWACAKRSKSRRFHALYDRLWQNRVIDEAWKIVRSRKGSAGVDGETIEEIENRGVEIFLGEIEVELKEGRYHPKPVRRVNMDKSDGRKRPLGIPTVKDRVVQTAVKLLIEPIFEADFQESVYGFRPKKSAIEALERIRSLANKGYNAVLDADIKECFGTIQQDKLMGMLKERISDRRILKLLRKWLEAGVMEEGEYKETEKGTPQGGVISPLLANIYLNKMDQEWKNKHGSWGEITRYADDFVIQSKSIKQARIVKVKVEGILKELGLEMNLEKTRIVDLSWGKEGFEFLGHHLRKMPSYRFRGKSYLNRWPSQAAMKKLRQRLKMIIHRRRFGIKSIKDLVPEINRVILGWREYFRSGNANRQFIKVENYIWNKLRHFECKRRFRQAPYWSREYDYNWYKNLGVAPLVGTIRYPKLSLVTAKVHG